MLKNSLPNLNRLGKVVLSLAEEKGFTYPKNLMQSGKVLKHIALIHSEVSEAMEESRVPNLQKFKLEIADIIIRVIALATSLDINIDDVIIEKLLINQNRPYKHNKLF